MTNFNIYFHIALTPNWEASFNKVNDHLLHSGILKYCQNIIYSVNGDIGLFKNPPSNVVFLASNDYTKEFEFPTINILKNDCSHDDNLKCLYIHTKGASSETITKPIEDWIDVMSHFTIHNYENCLNLLNKYDSVGVDYHTEPFKHFSGNFFWTKASHVNTLPYLRWENWRKYASLGDERHAAEAWVCKPEGKYYSLHETGIPVYERHLHEYPFTKYM
jgi:hypothetical protein